METNLQSFVILAGITGPSLLPGRSTVG